MKLGYGVIGSAITFKGNRYSRWNGQAEYFHLLYSLSRRPNIKEIYILSKNDFLLLPQEEKDYLDPHGKVIDAYSLIDLKSWKSKLKKSYSNDDERLDTEYQYTFHLNDVMKDIKLDRCIFYASQGMRSPIAIPGQLRIKRDPKTRGKVLAMSMNYSSPILNYINHSGVPWDLLGTDPRYMEENMYPRGLLNSPQNIFTQKDFKIKWETLDHYVSYDDYSESYKQREAKYANVEVVNTFGETLHNEEKNIDMIVLANNLMGPDGNLKANKRYLAIKEYLLEQDIGCNIYGKWPDEVIQNHSQFKGFLNGDESDLLLRKTKYTILFPLLKGWASGKFGEMLLCGVLPFIHPEYDTQKNILPNIPFLRVTSPSDLKRKIDFLNKNESERISLLDKARKEYVIGAENRMFQKFNTLIGKDIY
jgi:hypothetical protein